MKPGRAAMARQWVGCAGLAIVMVASPKAANAHGAVSMDQDVCKLTVGPHQMHFAGYQPEFARSEFCEDIPKAGRTMVVLDFVDDQLRDMKAQVQIAISGKHGNHPEKVVYELPAQVYPNGSIAIDYTFDEPGDFVGIVRVGEGDQMHEGRFPFSVGKSYLWMYLMAGTGALLVSAVGLFFWSERRRRLVLAEAARVQAV